MGGESDLMVGMSIPTIRTSPWNGLTGDLHEMEKRYGKTVRSTSGELSSNRKSAGIAEAILESELK